MYLSAKQLSLFVLVWSVGVHAGCVVLLLVVEEQKRVVCGLQVVLRLPESIYSSELLRLVANEGASSDTKLVSARSRQLALKRHVDNPLQVLSRFPPSTAALSRSKAVKHGRLLQPPQLAHVPSLNNVPASARTIASTPQRSSL